MKLRAIETYNAKIFSVAITLLGIAVILMCVFTFIQYVDKECLEYSIDAFFSWVNNESIAQTLLLASLMEIIAIPVYHYFQRKEIKKFYNNLNLKSVELLPNIIKFNYTKPAHNFCCKYSEISNLNMDIKTVIVRTKHGAREACAAITLKFKLKSRESNSIKYCPLFSTIEPIYKIIDATRSIKKFSLTFSGLGNVNDYEEKIMNYRNHKYKDMLGQENRADFKLYSWSFFAVFYLFWAFFTYTEVEATSHDMALFQMLSFVLLGLCNMLVIYFDISLIVDTIRDNEFAMTNNGENKPIKGLVAGFIFKIAFSIISYIIVYSYLLKEIQ